MNWVAFECTCERRTPRLLLRALGPIAALGLFNFGCASAAPEFAAPQVCDANDERRCEIDNNECFAVQQCSAPTHTWGECECSPSTVGAECTGDDDCAPLETCLERGATYLGGTLPTALCTLRCDEDAELCTTLSPPAVCVITDDRGTDTETDDIAHCLERCDVGAGPVGKCHERRMLACDSLNESLAVRSPLARMGDGATVDSTGVCRPLCIRDHECSEGHCDPRTGSCTDLAPKGEGFGQVCDPDSEEPGCAGVCVDVDGVGFCSQRCQLGDAADCGGQSGANPGLCIFPEASNGGVRDVGFCGELCNCNADCTHPDTYCAPFPDSRLGVKTGRAGRCEPRPESDEDAGVTDELDACRIVEDAGAPRSD